MPQPLSKTIVYALEAWYKALNNPVEFSTETKQQATYMRQSLNVARALDKELFELVDPTLPYPLDRLRTYKTETSTGWAVTIRTDPIYGQYQSIGIIIPEAEPIDAAAAWIGCQERLMRFKERKRYKRQLGGLTFEDLQINSF